MANTEDAWKAFQHTNELIKTADEKAGAVLAAGGVLGGVLVNALPAQPWWSGTWLSTALLLASIVLVSVSILLSLAVFVPRLRPRESISPLYFDNIARRYRTPDVFSERYTEVLDHEDQLQHALSEQIWVTSRIARRKFRAVAPAVWFFGAALITALLAGVIGT